MLQTIDVLIGFALVMLILSAIVTMLVQWSVQTVGNLKGKVLQEGITHLLRLLDHKSLTDDQAKKIAGHILCNELVGKKRLFSDKVDLASAIHREELVKLILDFAAGGVLERANQQVTKPTVAAAAELTALQTALAASLDKNGIKTPGDILASVRDTVLALEESSPDLASDVRQSRALIEHASSAFLGKINAWFDQTIDRTVETFTRRARWWTVVAAFLVAGFFQVDSFQLLHRLSIDKQTTEHLVDFALTQPDRLGKLKEAGTAPALAPVPNAGAALPAAPPLKALPAPAATPLVPAPSPTPTPTPTATPTPDSIDVAAKALDTIKKNDSLKELADTNLIVWPSSIPDWWDRAWGTPDKDGWTVYGLLSHLFGLLLTMGLLTLGAPVWYEILKDLIGLRSITAQKDDEQRAVRQTNQ